MNVDPDGDLFLEILAVLTIIYVVAAAANDIYQIASGNVSVKTSESSSTIEVEDSYKLLLPVSRFGYSMYINHFNSDTKNKVQGTTWGVFFEWEIHNLAYAVSAPLGIDSVKSSSKSLNAGRTIFSDDNGQEGGRLAFSIAMEAAYTLFTPTVIWVPELIIDEKNR